MQSSSGRILSRSALSAPTQKTRFASAATGAEPVTGASTNRICRAAAAAAIFFEYDASAQRRLFDGVGRRQHREQHVDLLGYLCRRIGKCSARTEQRLCFGASAIEHDQ